MPLGIDFTQILLHFFNVIILFVGLYILLYAPVKAFMQKRSDYYADLEKNTANAANRLSVEQSKLHLQKHVCAHATLLM